MQLKLLHVSVKDDLVGLVNTMSHHRRHSNFVPNVVSN